MNDVHFHLLINHFPIVGAVFAILVLVIGIVTRSEAIKRMAYGLFLLTAILSIPSNKSGENAEGHVKKIAGVDEIRIEKHEEMAELGLWTAIVTGLVSCLALFLSLKENDLKGIISIVVLAVALVAMYFLWQTGETGGKIRHTETYQSPA